MITVQVLQILILACQIDGVSNAFYEHAAKQQINCQNKLIKCIREKDKKQYSGDSVIECLLER